MILHVAPLEKTLDWLFNKNLDAQRGMAGFFLRAVRFLYLGYREYRRDFCWERAATLAFTTILSLLPLAVLFLGILNLFLSDAQVKGFVNDTVITYFFPGESESSTEELRTGIKDAIETNINKGIFELDLRTSFFSIIGLVVASLALLVSAERIFSILWNIRSKRSYFQKFIAFWMILTTSPFLVAVSFYVDSLSTSVPEHFVALYSVLLPTLVSCFAFSLMYMVLPHIRVRIPGALLGGFFAGILWEILKSGFYLYVKHASTLTNFYGSLGTIPIFLIFVYVTWLIILWGGELSYTFQNYDRLVHDFRLRQKKKVNEKYSIVFLGLYFLEKVVRAFSGGKSLFSVEDVADELEIYSDDFQPVVEMLLESGVIVENAAESGKYVLSRAPATVSLKDVMEKLLANSHREELDIQSDVNNALAQQVSGQFHLKGRKAYLETFEGKTLDDLGKEGAWNASNTEAGNKS